MKKNYSKALWGLFGAVVVLAALVCGVDQAVAGSNTPVEDGTTNIVGSVTVSSTNLTDVAPVPTGVVPLKRMFRVAVDKVVTLLGTASASTTNVTIGGGAATNTFYTGGSVTFTNSDGWFIQSEMPLRDRSVLNAYIPGTYGGDAASGLKTGTVNTATVYYWIVGRPSQGPSTPGGYR